MKKLIVVFAAALALLLSSCESYDPNDPTPHCYKFSVSVSYMGETATEEFHAFIPGTEVNKIKQEITELTPGKVSINVTKTNKSESECVY